MTRGRTAADRHAVTILGDSNDLPLVFVHGFGCDQAMWRPVAEQFSEDHRCVLLDLAGFGSAEPGVYDRERHATLQGHADDVIEVCEELGLRGAVFVGHSVASMIGVLASIAAPDLFSRLVLVGPSPRYVDDVDYVGGFSSEDIDDLLESLDSNYFAWARNLAPVIAGNTDCPAFGERLTESFCSVEPDVAKHFARVTFLADNRSDLAGVTVPTLILQCSDDPIAPTPVGEYVHRQIDGSTLQFLRARGHCPNLTAVTETAAAVRAFLG